MMELLDSYFTSVFHKYFTANKYICLCDRYRGRQSDLIYYLRGWWSKSLHELYDYIEIFSENDGCNLYMSPFCFCTLSSKQAKVCSENETASLFRASWAHASSFPDPLRLLFRLTLLLLLPSRHLPFRRIFAFLECPGATPFAPKVRIVRLLLTVVLKVIGWPLAHYHWQFFLTKRLLLLII